MNQDIIESRGMKTKSREYKTIEIYKANEAQALPILES